MTDNPISATTGSVESAEPQPDGPVEGEALASAAGVLRLSGSTLLLSGLLAGAAAVLQAAAWPPSTPDELPTWTKSHHLTLALVDECLVIGAVLLAVAVPGLWQALGARRRPGIATGVALIALSTPVSIVLGVVYGRLIYPACGIDVADDPQILALVLTTWAGGAHAVSLILMVAGLAIGAAMIRDREDSTALGVLGVAAGGTQLVVAYPWLFPVAVVTGCQIVLAAWLAGIGMSLLLRARPRLVTHREAAVSSRR